MAQQFTGRKLVVIGDSSGTTADVTAINMFLLSDRASWVTGAI
jgi:hypothetical protein